MVSQFSVEVRPCVVKFAAEMERILKQNDYKGGWGDCDPQYLQARLVEEVGEYFALVAKGSPSNYTSERFQKELLDIANFCMMLWSRSYIWLTQYGLPLPAVYAGVSLQQYRAVIYPIPALIQTQIASVNIYTTQQDTRTTYCAG